jgi:hypothetical protein
MSLFLPYKHRGYLFSVFRSVNDSNQDSQDEQNLLKLKKKKKGGGLRL